jgi:hypothetical protein
LPFDFVDLIESKANADELVVDWEPRSERERERERDAEDKFESKDDL